MALKDQLEVGAEYTYEKTISDDDIKAFAHASGDHGTHHLERDSQGRLIAHGLLTATLPTKIGGDLDYMAKTMHFDFTRPVFGGDRLTCTGRVASLTKKTGRIKVGFEFLITNQKGEQVLKGSTLGVIYEKK